MTLVTYTKPEFQNFIKSEIEKCFFNTPEKTIECKVDDLDVVITLKGTVDTNQTVRYKELDGKIRVTPNNAELIELIKQVVSLRTHIHFNNNGQKTGETKELEMEVIGYANRAELDRARMEQQSFEDKILGRNQKCIIA